MTYHLGTNPPAVPSAPSAPPAPQESSPEGSAWYKVTPTVLAWLSATYPSDPAIREDVINRVARELVFIGLPPGGNEMYFLSAGSTGNFSRPASSTVPYSVPATAPRMTYQQVLDVFEIRGGGPSFKRKQPAKINWGLYLGIGAGVAALVGLGVLAGRKRGGDELTQNRSTVYAIPERKAYPITTAKDAYHATQRLKQGRVKSEEDARRIISAIKREHHGIWSEYLKDYPVSRIMTSKRKGLSARRHK